MNKELYFPEHDKKADKICHTVAHTAKATKPEKLCKKGGGKWKYLLLQFPFILVEIIPEYDFVQQILGTGLGAVYDEGADRKQQSNVHIRKLQNV